MLGRCSVKRWWHSRQMLVMLSPRIVVMPGKGKRVEQVEHVGINVLESSQ